MYPIRSPFLSDCSGIGTFFGRSCFTFTRLAEKKLVTAFAKMSTKIGHCNNFVKMVVVLFIVKRWCICMSIGRHASSFILSIYQTVREKMHGGESNVRHNRCVLTRFIFCNPSRQHIKRIVCFKVCLNLLDFFHAFENKCVSLRTVQSICLQQLRPNSPSMTLCSLLR